MADVKHDVEAFVDNGLAGCAAAVGAWRARPSMHEEPDALQYSMNCPSCI
jgi:hypothetical protein